MLSTGEWIRNKRFLGLQLNLNLNSVPVFNSRKPPTVSTNFSVRTAKNLKTTGVSRIRNVASDYTSLVGLRTGSFLTKSELGGMASATAITVKSICGCQTGTVLKRGLCPKCR